MFFLAAIITLVTTLAIYLHNVYSRFSRHGVKNPTVIPFIGNMGRLMMKKDHFTDDINNSYVQFPNERFFGKYELMKPVVTVKDIELIKKIAVKDFDHFVDHRIIIDEKTDPLFGKTLVSLKGQKWKDMRSTLSPAFTSSKIKLMVPFMVEVGDEMVKTLKTKIQESKEDYIELESKDVSSRYATDVIASCAFGLKVHSQNEDNEFYIMGGKASTFSPKQLLIFYILFNFPWVAKALKLTVYDAKIQSFFRRLVCDTMEERERLNIVRPDMIHLLMEAKKGKLNFEEKSNKDEDAGFATVEESSAGNKKAATTVWSDDDLTAQALIFLLAGFETVSTAMIFLLYELAVNTDVQNRLAEEIREHDVKHQGKFDFNSIQNMEYMDMVVSESLRLWPPAIGLDRVCNSDYNMGRPNSSATEDYIIRKGEGIFFPVWAFHRDPKFFPNPEKFDPERFSAENKHNINPFVYMPFGIGPRNCIGSRFALCEVKVMVYKLLKSIELTPASTTKIPPTLSKKDLNMRMEGGQMLRFRIRQ